MSITTTTKFSRIKHPLMNISTSLHVQEIRRSEKDIAILIKLDSAFSIWLPLWEVLGFLGGSAVENLPANAGDMRSIPGSGRSPGEGNGNPLQYSCLENPMDRRAWWATVHAIPNPIHSSPIHYSHCQEQEIANNHFGKMQI